ncbi:uncharacterized protein TNIN_280891 [Trichonephila inaurata madagascariensis]|uniref:Uncharacterized protein n=1 Tax=Trichonephila inaurata madagascariensis TaxID=2747483 RepID=A0A8X6IKP1_9ARAC|nr:uncharacterized protein TNIN_280891 [Trichonephila inaurata madagascariensis]
MPNDPTFQHLLEIFFPYSYMETSDLHRVLGKDITTKGRLTKNLFFDLIADACAVLDISVHHAWSAQRSFFRTAVMQSAEEYVFNILCMCWVEKQVVTDIFDKTLSVVTFVKYMSEMVCFTTGRKFYKLNSQILTVFFENCLREDFKKRGGWKRLEKHILSRKYREFHDECAAYQFVVDDIPNYLKQKMRHSFVSMSGFPTELPYEKINDLTRKVMLSVGTSLLNEINSTKINKEKSVSKGAEGSSLTKTNVPKDSDMTCDGASSIEADMLKHSNIARSSEKHMNVCTSHLKQLEEKLKELISIFELLEAEHNTKGPFNEEFVGDITADAFAELEISVHGAWSEQLSNNRTVMTQSAEKYVFNIRCMCWLEKIVVTNIYDKTLSVVTFVKYMSEMVCFTTGRKFYKLNSQILTVFFENCLRVDFKKRGGWKRLEKHILSRKYREYHDECAAYHFVIDDIPDDLKRKIRQSFASKSGLPNELLGNKEKLVSKEAEGSSSTKANVFKDSDMLCDGASSIEADVLKDSAFLGKACHVPRKSI